jgi:GxxExxY protein
MPAKVHADIRRLSQVEFSALAYGVMRHVFDVHREFGRLFSEEIYQQEIARRCCGATEVPIEVLHAGFQKVYFIDLLVGLGGIFELKTVDTLNDRHRGQVLNYLFLSELSHAKLVNLRGESVDHEFVNTTLTRSMRMTFDVVDTGWSNDGCALQLRTIIDGLLHDLGTGLEIALYEEAVSFFLGGEDAVVQDVPIHCQDQPVGAQSMRLAAPGAAFRATALSDAGRSSYRQQLQRLLGHTTLESIHWINITNRLVTFETLRQKDLRQKNEGLGEACAESASVLSAVE